MSAEPPAVPEDGQEPHPRLPPLAPTRATWGLIAANVLVFALETLWGGSEWPPLLHRMGAITGRAALASEPWRVLSAAFLHIGFVHLLMNMFVLYVFGHFLEAVLGPWRMLALYAVSALGGGLASSLAHEQRLAAGASGAVWGLMVAEVVLLLRPRVLFEDIAFNVDKRSVLQPLVVNLLISLHPAIDMFGHLGGGVAGGLMMASGILARDPRQRIWRAAAAASGALMAASVVLASLHGRPWDLRVPALVPRVVPGTTITLPLPADAEPHAEGRRVRFGSGSRDPLLVEVEAERFEAVLSPQERDRELGALVRESAAETLGSGLRREEGPAVVEFGGRPAFHQAVRYPSGARGDLWYFIEGRQGLRLMIMQSPDAPPAWRGVPRRIASGVVFEAVDARPNR